MQPKNNKRKGSQIHLFQSRLEQILNQDHPLYRLSTKIDWRVFEDQFGALYADGIGRPGKPIRLLVGLHYLKYTYNESDETVVERFLENPYWQYFCGCEYFQHELPIDPSLLTKWRKRVGSKGLEKLLQETIETAKRGKLINKRPIERANIDTTVQEKAIAFPTDGRLYYKMLKALVHLAKQRGINIRQSYERVGKKALVRQGRYTRSKVIRTAQKPIIMIITITILLMTRSCVCIFRALRLSLAAMSYCLRTNSSSPVIKQIQSQLTELIMQIART